MRLVGVNAYIAKLAARAKMGKDKTHYGLSRTSTTSFFIHHVQRISLAAIVGDAEMLLLDDPLSAVDAHVGKREGIAVIWVAFFSRCQRYRC